MNNRKTGIILIVFFIALATAFVWYNFSITRGPGVVKVFPIYGNPGHKTDTFSFINQEGRVVTDKDVTGKIRVVEYFFTTCKGMCPKLNESMNRVYKAYRGNKDVLFLSHTVDPQHDTAGAMKAYSLKFEADPKQWIFLTGDKKRLYDMARESYLISAVDSSQKVSVEEDFIHDNHFALVDRGGRVRGFYDGLKANQMDTLISDIKALLITKD